MITRDMKRGLQRRVILAVASAGMLAFSGLANDAGAQRADTGRAGQRGARPEGRRGSSLRQGAGREGGEQGAPQARQNLERRVRQAMANQVRRELKLDDQKMRLLQQSELKFDQQRRALTRDERETRQSLRAALEDTTGSNDAQIGPLLDRLVQAQRRRADLLDAEQKDLSGFLSPRQRAQYFALRERVARRLADLQQGPPPGGRRGGPPPL